MGRRVVRTCARVSWVVEVAVAELWCATMAAAAIGLHRQQRKRGEEKRRWWPGEERRGEGVAGGVVGEGVRP